MVSPSDLDFYIANNLNVLFIGKHGVGKTSMVIDAFNRAQLKWKYFSASTMDPWVDFIGVPKEKKDEASGVSYLDLVRPRDFAEDEVEALFFDEYNRGGKKIRNAVMELIQFKSINGKRFENLKIVWAAINPPGEDEEERYDVEPLDPAQADRFHIHIDVPYEPSLEYFANKYGENLAKAAVRWWKDLPETEKNKVSPRRLDYALMIRKAGGNLRDVLPPSCGVAKLSGLLRSGPVEDALEAMFAKKDHQDAAAWLKNENNYAAAINAILERTPWQKYFIPLLPHEKIASLIATNTKALNAVAEVAIHNEQLAALLAEIIRSSQDSKLVERINRRLKKTSALNEAVRAKHDEAEISESRLKQIARDMDNENKSTTDRFGLLEELNDYLEKLLFAKPDEVHENRLVMILTAINAYAKRSHKATVMGNKTLFKLLKRLCAHCAIYIDNENVASRIETWVIEHAPFLDKKARHKVRDIASSIEHMKLNGKIALKPTLMFLTGFEWKRN